MQGRTNFAVAIAIAIASSGCGDAPASGVTSFGTEADSAGSDGDASGASASTTVATSSTGVADTGASSAGDSGAGPGSATDGSDDGAGDTGEWDAGNPDGACASGVPPLGEPVDTSSPTTVVGDGSPDSCTHAALAAAVAAGGIITFACGDAPVTIAIAQTLQLRTDVDTVIDGGRRVTLDGRHQVRVLAFESPDFMNTETRVTLQHLRVIGGKTSPVEAIPQAPPPCSQGYNDGEGGALYMRDGNLSIVDCIFEDNEGAPLGPDTGGGAIYVVGSKHGMVIAGSTFEGNRASNAAAVGGLFCELQIFDSLFVGNTATGSGANDDDPSQCDAMNNGQNEIGSGGNGGAIYSDGASVDVTLCGVQIADNDAGEGAFGGGLFFTSNDFGGDLTIRDTVMMGNTGGHWTVVQMGSTTDAGSAVGTNCRSLTIENSTLQGL